MTKRSTSFFLVLVSLLFCLFSSTPLFAQEQDSEADQNEPSQADQDEGARTGVLEEVITTGTRSTRPRTASDSTVPIDVLSGDAFDAYGGTNDITDNLKALVPSYTATPLTGDGSAFVRPTSLRGTAPDQTRVLVNGKRRHRSALLHFFAPAAGNGAHGVDIGMLPGIAIKRVEVLRDGASSQYGSDAIAGVVNFITKDADSGGEAFLQYGQFYEGEETIRFGANAGFGVGNGFINASLEYIDNEALIRAIQRPEAQQLIDAGVDPSLIGADAPFGEAPLLQTWGRPESDGTRIFVNAGFDLGNDRQLYAFANYADTFGRYRFFYRNPQHASLGPLRDMGFTGLPAGYTPYLDGDQEDYSIVVGLDGLFSGGFSYDFSVSYGTSKLDYTLNNTVNTSLGLDANLQIPQMDFDVGGYEQEEVTLNADFSKLITENINLAFGAEWREETYKIIAGEPNAYLGVKTSGFSAPRAGMLSLTSMRSSTTGRFTGTSSTTSPRASCCNTPCATRISPTSATRSTASWLRAGASRTPLLCAAQFPRASTPRPPVRSTSRPSSPPSTGQPGPRWRKAWCRPPIRGSWIWRWAFCRGTCVSPPTAPGRW